MRTRVFNSYMCQLLDRTLEAKGSLMVINLGHLYWINGNLSKNISLSYPRVLSNCVT